MFFVLEWYVFESFVNYYEFGVGEKGKESDDEEYGCFLE